MPRTLQRPTATTGRSPSPLSSNKKPPFRLVLGAGGMVGIAYHAGVLRAVSELGINPNDASLIVGTSAGSVMGSYLRVGTSMEDLWTLAIGTHPSFEGLGATPDERRKSMSLVPSFGSATDLSRRMIGSSWVLVRSFMPVPLPRVPSPVQRAFRAGLFSMSGARRQMETDLGIAWPERPLALCAVDLASGQRTVLSATSDVSATLSQAVLASCAVPGLYVPIRLGRRVFVDGGVHSSTNLDVALRHDNQPVVCIAPMDYTADDVDANVVTGVDALARLARRLPHRQLLGELAKAARQGTRVVLIRPTPQEVRDHGINLMRASGGELVAERAYDITRSSRALDEVAAVLA